MKVNVKVRDICTKDELDKLLVDCADFIKLDFVECDDGLFDVTSNMTFKCSFIKYMALCSYAKRKRPIVVVTRC